MQKRTMTRWAYFLLVTTFLLLGQDSSGQTVNTDTINKLNKDGKKEGWQIEYLDLLWHSVKKEKSYFYRYNYFINGQHTQPIANINDSCILKTDTTQTNHQKGNPTVLNGKYTWYDKDGNLLNEQQYKNGVRIGLQKDYTWPFQKKYNGTIAEEADYDKKYNNLVYSYYYKQYDKHGNIKYEGYFRFGEKGYAIYYGDK